MDHSESRDHKNAMEDNKVQDAEPMHPKKRCTCTKSWKKVLSKGRTKTNIEPLSCWITLFSAFMVNTSVAGLETAFPLFYDPLRDKYNASIANVGTSASLMISFGSICALLCTPLLNIYGCRPVAFLGCVLEFIGLLSCAFAPNIEIFHLCYGVLAGCGNGLMYIPSLTIVQQKFTYNRGLATGLALLGFTAGTILAPILFEYLLRTYGLFGSLLLQAGVHAQNFIFVWAFESPIQYTGKGGKIKAKEVDDLDECSASTKAIEAGECDQANEADVQIIDETKVKARQQRGNFMKSFCKTLMDFSICKDIKFCLYVIVRLGWFFCRFCINTHVVSAARSVKVELTKASYLPSVMGLCNLILRSFSTLVLNIKKLDKEIYFCVGIVAVMSAGVFAAVAQGYYFFLLSMILVGINEGVSTTSQPLVVANLVGIESFGKAMAVVEIATVPASLAAGPFSGWLVDKTGNYLLTFLFAAGSGLLSLVLIIIIIILSRIEQRKKRKSLSLNNANPTEGMQELQPLEKKLSDIA